MKTFNFFYDKISKFLLGCGKLKYRIPARNGKPGKWEGIFQSGKSKGILDKLEKVRMKKFEKYWKMRKNAGIIGEICQSGKVGTMEISTQ